MLRIWSNEELGKFSHLFDGDVVNVSAWKDEDTQGNHYRDYFSSRASYSTTNWHGERGAQGTSDEILLDLKVPVPEELAGRYDVVFSHTTLEHLFDVFTAFRGLCELSRDVVILTVPCLQHVHFGESYLDYSRFTPFTLRELCRRNGLTIVYESVSPFNENAAVYLFCVATKDPEKWLNTLPHQRVQDSQFGFHVVRNDLFTHMFTIAYRALRTVKQVFARVG